MGIARTITLLFFLFVSAQLLGQQKYVRHTVQPGETVYAIAKKYNVSEAELIRYNPDIKTGLQEGVILIIPAKAEQTKPAEKQPKQAETYFYYTVQAKETLYGLSKRFHCTVEEIIDLNPHVKNGLREEDVIKIPKRDKSIAVQQPISHDSTKYVYHVVEPKETVFSICKAAGITEQEFLDLNPFVREKGLQIGQTIRWPKETTQAVEDVPTDQPPKPKDYGIYRIMPGDDLVSIAAKYSTTVEVLIRLNPELKNGIIIGRYIVVPAKKKMVAKPRPKIDEQSVFWQIPEVDEDRPRVHFALLLPLYLWDNDTLAAEDIEDVKGSVFAKSKVALQFLVGVKVAMDTLAGLGYDVELDIFDTDNNPETVKQICRRIDKSTDAIIGPLFSRNVDIVSKLLPDMPIISPLSKALDNSSKPNLINCVPSLESEFEQMAYWLNDFPEPANIIFVNTSTADNHQAVNNIKKHLYAEDTIGYQELWVDAEFSQLNHIDQYLKPDVKNILVVVDQDAAFVSDFLTKVSDRADEEQESPIFVLGSSKLFEINTLENRYLNNHSIIGLSGYFVNVEDTATQMFIQKFRLQSNTEPDRFAYNGYDTGLYFAQLFATYGQLPEVQQWPQVKGLYKGFYFVQKPGAGPTNSFVYKLCVRNYSLRCYKQ